MTDDGKNAVLSDAELEALKALIVAAYRRENLSKTFTPPWGDGAREVYLEPASG